MKLSRTYFHQSTEGTAVTAKGHTDIYSRRGSFFFTQSESGKTKSVSLSQAGIPIYEIGMNIFNQNPPSAKRYYVTIDMDEQNGDYGSYDLTTYWEIHDGAFVDVDLQGVTECELDFPGMYVIDIDNGENQPPYRIVDRDYRRLLVNADSNEPHWLTRKTMWTYRGQPIFRRCIR